jgi:hypothetical protein
LPNEVQFSDPTEVGEAGISYISAPASSPAGTVSLQLVLNGMPSKLNANQIEHYAECFCATAALITDEITVAAHLIESKVFWFFFSKKNTYSCLLRSNNLNPSCPRFHRSNDAGLRKPGLTQRLKHRSGLG